MVRWRAWHRAAGVKPFFPYFGSKWRTVPSYPAPEHDLIVEPFAGSAGYATRYAERKVLLIDRDPVVVEVWQYLIRVKPQELLSIPDVREHISELETWPQEVRWLVGFWLSKGNAKPQTRPSLWCRSRRYPDQFWGEAVRRRLAGQVERIRHWKVMLGLHGDAPSQAATWFIDPPYQGTCGRRYRGGHRGLDYAAIGSWCRLRRGLVIVCEQAGAAWLPFRSFRRIKASHHTAWSEEVVWIRREPQQLQLPGTA